MNCERCNAPKTKGERFCKECRKVVLKEMKEAGYLTRRPSFSNRSSEMRENTYETKNGRD